MLVFSENQISALKVQQRDQFLNEMCAHISAAFPTVGSNQDALRQVIVRKLEDAHSYGFSSRYDLRRYLEFTFEIGAGNDPSSLPWANEILTDSVMHPMEKMDRIDQAMTFEHRNIPT